MIMPLNFLRNPNSSRYTASVEGYGVYSIYLRAYQYRCWFETSHGRRDGDWYSHTDSYDKAKELCEAHYKEYADLVNKYGKNNTSALLAL